MKSYTDHFPELSEATTPASSLAEDFEDRGDWFPVIGEIRLYRFQDAYPASAPDKIIQHSEVTVGSDKMEEILDYFAACEDVTK